MRSFEKSWDLETTREIGSLNKDQIVSIHEKYDGYLIVARYWEGNLLVSSRGSFESVHAVKAKELLLEAPWLEHLGLDHHYTFVFELLWEQNPIVVQPKKDELVLLAAFLGEHEASPGLGGDMEEMLNYWIGGRHGTMEVPRYADTLRECHMDALDQTLATLEETRDDHHEGYVLVFSDGYRAKMKTQWYKDAERLMRLSNKMIWRRVIDGDMEFFERVDSHTTAAFATWVMGLVAGWQKEADGYMVDAREVLEGFRQSDMEQTRKALAEVVETLGGPVRKLVYMLDDGKEDAATRMSFQLTKPETACFFSPEDNTEEN
jgi:hypothetical protein